ncbi:hypothetical protein B1757_02670 [Acidithiobacillus marinus]|uniref:Uncharacterized protein n=1 Tax=Acidithiobacillus marinus TaxID=187490 RepID=A0A2I1DPA7_9PROT|nr:hypothetical protein [Acidithiobacillus marinus]PKY11711.1 hypothetical protein B1757_02670 [Acidithiobacillus marinus]
MIEENAPLITAEPADMVHLIKFLAATWAEVDAWAHTLDADVLMRYPVVQGLRAQMALRKLGIRNLVFTRHQPGHRLL